MKGRTIYDTVANPYEGLDTEEEREAKYRELTQFYTQYESLYKEGMERWKIVDDGKRAEEQIFSKTILTVAAGAFGISFAFIDKIVPLEMAVYKPVLGISWMLFGVCLICRVLNPQIAAMVYHRAAEEIKQNLNRLRMECD
jgi:hypothetical protein